METQKGNLKATQNGFHVVLLTTKGSSAVQSIPMAAMKFHPSDATDGLELDVELDDDHRVVKVTIPGKEPTPASGSQADQSGKRDDQRELARSQTPEPNPAQPQAVRGLVKAPPKALGLPFHNAYTFLPFGNPPRRRTPTPLSIDELPRKRQRLTGILELDVTTKTPLLTCNPRPVDDENGHKTYEVLRIGPDVIVPATGIRGALRSLLTILTGGTLGYVNRYAYLCQGRDLNLGPRGFRSPPGTPRNVFLAEVIRPGTAFRSGVVQLGETKLVPLDALERCYRARLPRGRQAQTLWVGLDSEGEVSAVSEAKTADTPWKLKASGRPINFHGKREGLFRPEGKCLDLPPELWEAYSWRNVHGDRPEPRAGDLVWLEPKDPDAECIEKPEDVASIQWARWGRRGESLEARIRQDAPHVVPDSFRPDRRVDEVTNLFGQVPERGCNAPSFAARVRPENLVFFDATDKVQWVALAPLAPPHPGCIAFYRRNRDPDAISESDPLRGYKVYRTTNQHGEDAPWLFRVQGVYGKQGELLRPQQKVNKTCDLLAEDVTGTLRISFRGLTKRELALLLQACAVPWRIGGGKPLGLGLYDVRFKRLIGENGEPLKIAGWNIQESDQGLAIVGWEKHVRDIQGRVQMWRASQQPVPNLRYPRAVDQNQFRKQRGGHAWFQRHASPRMVKQKESDQREPGLEPLYIDGELLAAVEAGSFSLDPNVPMIAGQVLPVFDPDDPLADLLYGYDGFGAETEDREAPRRRVFLKIEAFDPARHVTGSERSEGSHGKNAESRKAQKRRRKRGR